MIDVIDNGIGLPKENRSRLLEPYVTTREKGTGLGLPSSARSWKIMAGRSSSRDAAETHPGPARRLGQAALRRRPDTVVLQIAPEPETPELAAQS